MNNLPIVTIFTPSYYTKAIYVIQAIDAIYNQTYKNIEHILINDAPLDNSEWPIVLEYVKQKEYPSQIIEHKENKGICYSFNEIISLAKGKYYLGCGDDLWQPDHVERMVAFFEKQPEQVAAIHGYPAFINEHGEPINHPNPFRELGLKFGNWSTTEKFKQLLRGNYIAAPATMMRTDTIKKVGGYDERFKAEDQQMWLKLTQNGYDIKYVDQQTVFYRIHSESVTGKQRGRGSEEPCLFYLQYLGINKEYDKILAPRYYQWTNRLLMYENYSSLKWPLLTVKLNKNIASIILVIKAIRNKIKTYTT